MFLIAESGNIIPSMSRILEDAEDGHSNMTTGPSLIKSVGEGNVISEPRNMVCEDTTTIKDLEDKVRRL